MGTDGRSPRDPPLRERARSSRGQEDPMVSRQRDDVVSDGGHGCPLLGRR